MWLWPIPTKSQAALSAAVTRWGTLLEIPGYIMGTYVIAVGAQIPDTLAAVAFARRGQGSMAIASAIGSQVINVLIGLGLPWLIATAAGQTIELKDSADDLLDQCALALCAVAFYLIVLMAPSMHTWGGVGFSTLGHREGYLLTSGYAAVATAYGIKCAMGLQVL